MGYYVCANRVNIECANHGEWLYDVTWIEYEEDRIPATHLKEIPFVAECEWGNNQDVKEDFEKLLQARAGIRLMICNGWKRSNENFAQEVAERLANMVGVFNDSQSNDVNILVTWKRVEGAPYQWNFDILSWGPAMSNHLRDCARNLENYSRFRIQFHHQNSLMSILVGCSSRNMSLEISAIIYCSLF